MLVLALSGAVLVARRAGGWRRWFASLRGPLPAPGLPPLHAAIERLSRRADGQALTEWWQEVEALLAPRDDDDGEQVL